MPDIGEVFEVEGYKFKVQSMRGQRISLVRVTAPVPGEVSAENKAEAASTDPAPKDAKADE